MRERITNFPIIPGSSLKGVLLQTAREHFENGTHARGKDGLPAEAKLLFGAIEEGEDKKQNSNAGCVQIMEAKLLAFPVRSLAGCFAWITCPSVLERYQRDTGKIFTIPPVAKEQVIAGADLIANNQIVLEEYAFALTEGQAITGLATALQSATNDPLWTSKLKKCLALVNDEIFQHFVTTCTEVVTRVKINPKTRTVDGGALFNQENVPCEALFYSVLSVLPPRRETGTAATELLTSLLKANPTLQIGGDETTGHGLCELKQEALN
jgi:CRISPR-associated protein Cmr4